MIGRMGLGGWLVERLKRLDRPADQSVLDSPRGGSERMIDRDSAAEASATARNVRRERNRRRHRWGPH